jgi:hypothetical protein
MLAKIVDYGLMCQWFQRMQRALQSNARQKRINQVNQTEKRASGLGSNIWAIKLI